MRLSNSLGEPGFLSAHRPSAPADGRRRARRLALAICLALATPLAAGAQNVRLAQGRLEGARDGAAEVFKAIPYAPPPTGELRWRPPGAPPAWSGVKREVAYSAACPQTPFQFGPMTAAVPPDPPFATSEDCLYLNVWRPAGTAPGAKLPVMVWIYGGGFGAGRASMPTYSGAELVKRGVVLVTFNYRLGALGFLAAPGLTAESPHHSSGDYGLLDQVAALRWVKANISAFGGAPDRVTIFGESAGGVSVGLLTGSPLARGLFQRAISESGVFFGPTPTPGQPAMGEAPLADAEVAGANFLKRLGASSVADARKLSAETILTASQPGPGKPVAIFTPIADGWFLPAPLYEIYRAKRYNAVPVLLGWNDDEGALMRPPPGWSAGLYANAVKARYGEHAGAVLAAYPAETDAQAMRANRDLQRDATFAWAGLTWARLQAATGGPPVYVYNFDHRPPYPAEPSFAGVGAIHTSELPYVFGTLAPGPLAWTDADRRTSDAVMRYWTDFAKAGDPNGSGLPIWRPFTPALDDAMHFGAETPQMGRIAGLPRLKVLDAYFAAQR